MKNLRISRQLLLLVTGLFVAFAAAVYFQISASSEALYNARYDTLRTQVQSAVSVLKAFHEREAAGELSRDEAQAQAFKTLTAMKFDPDGYFFGYDYDVVMKFHPDARKVGKSAKGVADPKGYKFRDELVRLGRAGGGQTNFYASKPGEPDDAFFRKSGYALAFEPWQVVVVTGLYIDDLDAQVTATIWKALSIGLLVFGFGIAAAWSVIRGITRPLQAIHTALQAVADENVTIDIPHTNLRNEVGLMATATQSLQLKVRERHEMARRQAEQQAEINAERQHNLDLQREEAELQAHVVATIGEAMEVLATGDLTIRCGDLGPGYSTLREHFNNALARLEAAMSKVNGKGADIGGSKEEIRNASLELARRTEQQAANLEETVAAVDELSASVRHTAEGASEASKRVQAVSVDASRSDAIVSQAIEAMSGIEKSSDEISKIIGVIDEIAFQTNLLALNAGVEAARAGESGKGFAVVAQEVRELAQRSAAAAKEIKEQISRSSGQVVNGVKLVGEAGEALKRISSQITAANEIVAKIAYSAREQDSTLRSINGSMNQLDVATQQNAAMAEETTASAQVLADDTEELLNLIRGFRISDRGAPTETGRQPQWRKAG